jgi:CRISPR/Cas system-associated endonuclease Cas1
VLNLINKKIIRLTDFYKPDEKEPAAFDFAEEESNLKNYPILLTHEGMKKYITAFEDRMNQKILYLPQGKRLSYRDICLEQVRLLARHLKDEAQYAAYIMK